MRGLEAWIMTKQGPPKFILVNLHIYSRHIRTLSSAVYFELKIARYSDHMLIKCFDLSMLSDLKNKRFFPDFILQASYIYYIFMWKKLKMQKIYGNPQSLIIDYYDVTY